jgi:hypothetical protein
LCADAAAGALISAGKGKGDLTSDDLVLIRGSGELAHFLS